MDAQRLEPLLTAAMNAHGERMQRWIRASHLLAKMMKDPSIFTVDLQQVGRLDCFLVELEKTVAASPAPEHIVMAVDFHMLLSRSWLALAYEALRAVLQRERDSPLLPRELLDTFYRLELVRVPELKREVAGPRKLEQELYLTPAPHRDDDQPVPYRHRQTVWNIPKEMDTRSGSMIWHAYDVKSRTTVEIRRRELADGLLSALEMIAAA
ncbi:MAG: hypothetical protein NW223_23880 [Hyphomicrobiaceae bacterium]|nr:hypothetical protein [Hyphomicrobiaceae bacterium]